MAKGGGGGGKGVVARGGGGKGCLVPKSRRYFSNFTNHEEDNF